MSKATKSKKSIKRNSQALTSLVLGIMSLVCAIFNLSPGLLSVLGCLSATAGFLAIFAGIRGAIGAKLYNGQGRRLAIGGIIAGGIGILIFVIIMTVSVQEKQRQIEILLTPEPPSNLSTQ